MNTPDTGDQSTAPHDQAFLLAGLRQGDPVVFRIIHRLYWRKLFNLAYHYLRSVPDAEDVVQDVFISLWARREKLELRGPLDHYLARCAKFTAFFYLKVSRRRAEMINRSAPALSRVADHGTEEYLGSTYLQDYLGALLASRSERTRDIFYLSRYDGLTYPEIAQRLQISVKTVEYHISVALKKVATGKF